MKAAATQARSGGTAVSILAQTAAWAILLAGAFGEGLALYALYLAREPGSVFRRSQAS